MTIKSLNTFKTLKEQLESINYDRFDPIDFSKLNRRFASLTTDADLAPFDLYVNTNSTEIFDSMVGQYQPGTQGRWFRLAENGAVALVRGNVVQSKATDSQFQIMSVTASAIVSNGVQTATVTNGTTTVNVNDFVNGSIGVYTTPDLGSDYIIMGHTGNVTSGNAITVYLERPLQNAWTTSTKVNMKPNPWKYVIQAPTTLTGAVAGVAVFACSATTVASGNTQANPVYYTWLQTHGVGTVLADNTAAITVGNALSCSTATAGAVVAHPYSGANTPPIGVSLNTFASGATNHDIPAFFTVE